VGWEVLPGSAIHQTLFIEGPLAGGETITPERNSLSVGKEGETQSGSDTVALSRNPPGGRLGAPPPFVERRESVYIYRWFTKRGLNRRREAATRRKD